MNQRIALGLIPLALLLVSACSPVGASDGDAAPDMQAVRFDLPVPGEAEPPEGRQPFVISGSGDLTLDGKPLSGEQIASAFKAMQADGLPAARVTVDPKAPLSVVVSRLSELGRAGDYTLSDLRQFKEFGEPGAAASGPAYRGALGGYEMAVTVALAADGNSCLAALQGRALGPRALQEQSFQRLDRIVFEAGGLEAIVKKIDDGTDIVAHIQSAPQTPWRCVAGAIYAVQFAGWPIVQLEAAGG
jgi:hypothetical protein